MKLKQSCRIGTILSLIVSSACSKRDGQPAAGADSSNQNVSISLRNVYSMSLGAAHFFTVSELQNTGKVAITAFQGQLTIKDDLDNTLEASEVRFTSDTPYFTAEGIKSSHVISPGESIYIMNRTLSTEAEQALALDKFFATDKENLMKINNVMKTKGPQGMVDMFGFEGMSKFGQAGALLFAEPTLDGHRVTKKTAFAVDKIVTQ